jgi:hypothetical protein
MKSFADIRDEILRLPLTNGNSWDHFLFSTFSGPIPKQFEPAAGVIMIAPEEIESEINDEISITGSLEYCQKPPFANLRDIKGKVNLSTREFTFSDSHKRDIGNWTVFGKFSENGRVLYLQLAVDADVSPEFFLLHEDTAADFIPD